MTPAFALVPMFGDWPTFIPHFRVSLGDAIVAMLRA
jgi:hypothetical protein